MLIPEWLIALTIILAIIFIALFYILGKKTGAYTAYLKHENEMPSLRRQIADSSRGIIKGQVAEQLAPYLPDFPFNPAECRFLGSPVDIVVFRNSDDAAAASVVFVEIKSGNAKLTQREKNIKNAVCAKRVEWHEYRFRG